MLSNYTVSLERIIKELGWRPEYLPCDASELTVRCTDINRPGLALNGYFEFFDPDRIQIIGKSEFGYLAELEPDVRAICVEDLAGHKPPAIVVTRDLEVFSELREACEKHKIPLLRTSDTATDCMAQTISFLNVELAPRITEHGVLVEVYGEGVLLVGDSGIGKSETAIELVKRGHRLIADDAVEIRRVSQKTLVGSAPENIRHFVELRGVGVVNARRIFGMGAVKITEKIDMAICLETWDPEKVYERMGLETETKNILGNEIPLVTIPVKPGRNLAIIIEVAAMNNRQKKMGYNATYELLKNLGMDADIPKTDWYNNR